MDLRIIHHSPRHFDHTLLRTLEFESDCPDCPPGEPHTAARCPECEATMVYRGIGRLRGGARVHYFECIHSYREVHSLSMVIAD